MNQQQRIAKICGVRTVEAAVAAASGGADIIGMIFAPSPRLIDLDTAQNIARAVAPLRAAPVEAAEDVSVEITTAAEYFTARSQQLTRLGCPLLCGVFQNQPLEHILEMVQQVPLDLVQLHGTEPAALAQQIPVPVIKVFHVDGAFSVDADSELFQTSCHSVILLDTKFAGTAQQGGRGVSFDWTIARRLADQGVPFLMAGGLTPDNVQEAISVGKPWGVDVSSGVETDKAKDPAKIQAFIDNVRRA
ncbi:anthranilate synthase / indole-3-glycerol phosphate synthase [Coemansia sp. RSA 2708]|nr:anthranilate synthase / indole-3-glycerol phosphate synthase [Coemansia sp. RSA 2708]